MGRTSIYGGSLPARIPVLKPWGDSLEYDVGIEQEGSLLCVQVKSSTARNGTGYLCQFRRNYNIDEPYSLDDLDLFAMYVIPENVWYLIPSAVILLPKIKIAVTLLPRYRPQKGPVQI